MTRNPEEPNLEPFTGTGQIAEGDFIRPRPEEVAAMIERFARETFPDEVITDKNE